jgi:hypothetical protein
MPKVSNSRKDHRQPQSIGGVNHYLILNRAARLNYGGNAGSGGSFDPVGKGKKGIRSHYCASGFVPGFAGGQFDSIDPAAEAAANSDCGGFGGKHYGVALDMLAGQPGEFHSDHFRGRRLALGDHSPFSAG